MEQAEVARVADPPSPVLPRLRGDAVQAALHRVEVAHLYVQTTNLQVGDAQRRLGAAQDDESRGAAQSEFDASQRTLRSALAALEGTQQDLNKVLGEANVGQ